MKCAALMLAAVMLTACEGGTSSTLPDGVTDADVALFKAAVADAGCVITTNAQADPVAARTGFSDDKLTLILQYLTLSGESEVLPSGFRLTTGSCANA